MQKIPTLFIRDETVKGHPVTNAVKPECQWVLDGEGYATVKVDGTNVRIVGGALERRQKPKERDYDDAAYVPCDRSASSDRWAWEAFDALEDKRDGIYELRGPKVQGNPDRLTAHVLTRVVPVDPTLLRHGPERGFDAIRAWLAENVVEGLVFHHDDGRMAKIKRRDFGLTWPVQE